MFRELKGMHPLETTSAYEPRWGDLSSKLYGVMVANQDWGVERVASVACRCIFVVVCVLFMWPSFNVVLVDQVSVVIPLMKLKKSTKVVFYCHFPDLLLAQHITILWQIYRKPIDFIEEVTTGMADLIMDNSRFIASTFAGTFKHLHARGIKPSVLYPAVNVEQFDKPHAFK
ncbi:hypothetical protein RHSIM_Rhsim02G0229600 [Rhododendron simsii]|uniref:Alpha-1,3/1,6-mannosyltransferase ALG2 n=1 Tax=Rhododendron simsii TaxID=118357 RepID=A0A834HHZ7_RHOSS|nr:hypothetical protein RHSIM_Rhsim02G0229600 [Rhododendron simsii]